MLGVRTTIRDTPGSHTQPPTTRRSPFPAPLELYLAFVAATAVLISVPGTARRRSFGFSRTPESPRV